MVCGVYGGKNEGERTTKKEEDDEEEEEWIGGGGMVNIITISQWDIALSLIFRSKFAFPLAWKVEKRGWRGGDDVVE